MQLKNLGNSLNAVKDIESVYKTLSTIPNGMPKLAQETKLLNELTSKYSVETLKLATSQMALTAEQTKAIFVAAGLADEELEQAVATATVSASQTTATATTGGLSAAFQGLAASIGISTAALGAILAGLAVFAGAFIAFKAYRQHMEELVQSANEAGSAWQEQNKSLDENISKIKELKDALASGTLTEEEATQTKSELLDIQNQLKDSYGEQAAGIDLVNGKLETQIGLLQQLSQEEANNLINENKKGFDEAERQMNKNHGYTLASSTFFGNDVKDLIDEYEHISYAMSGDGQGYTIKFYGDATEAEEEINDFQNRLKELNPNLADYTANYVSDALQKNQEILDEYQDTYNQYLQADMYSQGFGKNSPATLLNEYAEAVENYNNALSEGDKSTITDASKEYQAVKDSVDSMLASGDNEKYTVFFDEVAAQLDEATISLNNFKDAYNDDQLNKFKEIFKDYDMYDLKSFNFDSDGKLSQAESTLQGIIDKAIELGLVEDNTAESVSTVVDRLADMGIVSDGITEVSSEIQSFADVFYDTFNSDAYSDVKEDLLKLAKAGEISPEVLKSTEEYNNLLSETGLSAEEAKDKITSLLTTTEKLSAASQGMSSLGDAYDEFKEKGSVFADTLDSLPDVFKNLEGYDAFEKIVGNPKNGVEKIQEVFNQIAKEYLLSQNTLSGLLDASEEEIQIYIANLKQMGITNAEEVVKEAQATLAPISKLLDGAEAEYVNYLNDKIGYTEEYVKDAASLNGRLVSSLGEGYKTDYENWVNLLTAKKDAYNKLVNAINISQDKIKKSLDPVASKYLNNPLGEKITQQMLDKAQMEYNIISYAANQAKQTLQIDLSTIDVNFGGGFSYSGGSGSGSSSSDSSTKDTTETYDWLETKLDRLTTALDNLKREAEDFQNAYVGKNTALTKAITQANSNLSVMQKAYDYYMNKANSVGLSSSYIEKIKNGQILIEDITDENLQDKIDKFQEWYEKALDVKDEIAELNIEIKELKLQKLDNITTSFGNAIDYYNSIADLYQGFIDLAEVQGKVGKESDYNMIISQKNQARAMLTGEYNSLVEQFNTLVKDGTIKKYTDDWYDWQIQIKDLRAEIVQLDAEIVELRQSILEVRWDTFEKAIIKIENLQDKYSSLADLIDDTMVFSDDSSKLTSLGYTKLGLLQYDLARSRQAVADYDMAIKTLNEEYQKGYYSQEQYEEKLADLQKSQLEYVKSIKDTKDAILDYVKEGIERETEAMDELIQKRKDDLSLQKEYYDFQKKMTDQSKEINKIRAELAATEGDDSLEGQAKRRKLQSQLQELEDQYNEDLKDHEYDVVQDAYDETLEKFKENQEEYLNLLESDLDEQNKVISGMLQSVYENHQTIYDELKVLGEEYGISLTESLTAPFKSAIAAWSEFQSAMGNVSASTSINTGSLADTNKNAVSSSTQGFLDNYNAKSAGGSWKKDSKGWWYQYANGSYAQNEWILKNDKWYHFDDNGYMQTGWQKVNNQWYYMDKSGAMQTGWQAIKGKWYYMNPNGAMTTGWQKIGGKWYYMDKSGAMTTGWQQVNDKWYYMDKSGAMLTSQWIDGKYYVDHTGAMATYGYVKDPKSNKYWWVNEKGEYEPKWTTTTPDLKKYKLYYNSGTKNAKDDLAYIDDTPDHKLDLGSEVIITKQGVLRQMDTGDMVFSKAQKENLWEISNGNIPINWDILPSLPDYSKCLSMVQPKTVSENITVHYDNLIGNIEYVDKNALPDLETILKKSFDYNVKELKKYSKR